MPPAWAALYVHKWQAELQLNFSLKLPQRLTDISLLISCWQLMNSRLPQAPLWLRCTPVPCLSAQTFKQCQAMTGLHAGGVGTPPSFLRDGGRKAIHSRHRHTE